MYPEYKLVQACLRKIEAKLGWGPSEAWHNDVFLELSERIQQRTQVLLSPTTLKRVWGRVDYRSAPSITTLNTLAQFAGFQNWRDFKSKAPAKKPSRISRRISANLGIIMLGASVMTIVFISFFSLKGSKNVAEIIDPSTIVFKSKPIAKGLPNSVVFDLDLGNIKSDSILIQQYWDPTKTINISTGQTQATGQYYYPGYFRAKLLVDGEAIKQHDLFIKSEGWLGTLDYRPIPKYVPNNEVVRAKLSFSEIIQKEIADSEEPLTSTFHMVQDFKEVSGDNFVLHSSLKNSYREKWAVCQSAAITILGTKSAIVVNFSIPGCVSELGVMMSDVYKSGKKHDLSGLGIDLSYTRDLKIEVRDKQFSVSMEGESLFNGSYSETLGRIVGLRYRFLGAGEVSRVKLTDLSGELVVMEENFASTE